MSDPRPSFSGVDPRLVPRPEDNPVRRVVMGGETLRRRLDIANAVLDFPILHDLKAQGATDYLALPIASAHGWRNYMVTYVTDRPVPFGELRPNGLIRARPGRIPSRPLPAWLRG